MTRRAFLGWFVTLLGTVFLGRLWARSVAPPAPSPSSPDRAGGRAIPLNPETMRHPGPWAG